METRSVDPRDTTWEQDHAQFCVYFWDTASRTSHEYELLGEPDIDEVLAWVKAHASEHAWSYTLYVIADDGGRRGLIRLAGVKDDPFPAE